jgi:hypothetical protein
VWVQVEEMGEVESLRAALKPDVLAPAANATWVRWMRIEHSVRRASLAGVGWELELDGDGSWVRGPEAFPTLLMALEAVTRDVPEPVVPGTRRHHIVPRTGFAVERAGSAAIKSGLIRLSSEPAVGFAAHWPSGVIKAASSIVGALQIPSGEQ